jgi:hypothetical protein
MGFLQQSALWSALHKNQIVLLFLEDGRIADATSETLRLQKP